MESLCDNPRLCAVEICEDCLLELEIQRRSYTE